MSVASCFHGTWLQVTEVVGSFLLVNSSCSHRAQASSSESTERAVNSTLQRELASSSLLVPIWMMRFINAPGFQGFPARRAEPEYRFASGTKGVICSTRRID